MALSKRKWSGHIKRKGAPVGMDDVSNYVRPPAASKPASGGTPGFTPKVSISPATPWMSGGKPLKKKKKK